MLNDFVFMDKFKLFVNQFISKFWERENATNPKNCNIVECDYDIKKM